MKITAYLVIRNGEDLRVTKRTPNLEPNEIALKINVTAPSPPRVVATLDIELPDPPPAYATVEVVEYEEDET